MLRLCTWQVPSVRRAAAALLLQLGRKTPSLAAQVCAGGCPTALTKYLQMEKEGDGCSMGITLGGTLASYSPTTAKAVVDAAVGSEVVQALRRGDSVGDSTSTTKTGTTTLKPTDSRGKTMALNAAGYAIGSTAPGASVSITAAAAWALEQMSQHGDETTMPLIGQGALAAVLERYKATAGAAGLDSADSALFVRCKATIKSLIRYCNSTTPLEPLVVKGTPPAVLKHVLRRAEPLLARDAKSRQQFVTTGGLMRLQELESQLCAKGQGYLNAINALFPVDVVTYYRQGSGMSGSGGAK